MVVRFIAGIIVAITLPFSFAGCGASDDNNGYEDDPSDPEGMGMTYGGKLGYDGGGGLVLPYDGSAPGMGFGF